MSESATTPEFSAVMPCLDEAETLATCIRKARSAFERLGLAGEVVVADNGSTDGSQAIARECGARVVDAKERGYGSALMSGIAAAKGRFIIMADSDDSYDWSDLDRFVDALRGGAQLVMGCRFPRGGGTIEPGAMPFLHRYLGTPLLSGAARLFFKSDIRDVNCGMRGFAKEAIEKLELRATGMEFASEMIVKASLAGLRMEQVPIALHPDGRTRAPHLRSFRDGWRHLRFLLMLSPTWLFLVPGGVLFALGLSGFALILQGTFWVGSVGFDVNTLLVCAALVIAGFQIISFGVSARVFAVTEGFYPVPISRWFDHIKLETGLILGGVLTAAGLGTLIAGLMYWSRHDFGALSAATSLRITIPAITLIALGIQVIFASFFLSILGLKGK